MGKYDKYICKLSRPPFLPKRCHPEDPRETPLMVDANNLPVMTHHIEVMTIDKDGTQDYPGIGFELPMPEKEEDRKMLEKWLEQSPSPLYRTKEGTLVFHHRPMYHTKDEIFLFLGTNPDDPTDLGGEVEFWLGLGDRAEKHVITKSSVVFVPAGLVHVPLVFKNVRRPIKEVVIFTAPTLAEHGVDEWPPDYKPPITPSGPTIVDIRRTRLVSEFLPK